MLHSLHFDPANWILQLGVMHRVPSFVSSLPGSHSEQAEAELCAVHEGIGVTH